MGCGMDGGFWSAEWEWGRECGVGFKEALRLDPPTLNSQPLVYPE